MTTPSSSTRRWFMALTALAPLALATPGALAQSAPQTVSIGAEAVPHAEILEFIKPQLAREGIELKVRVFTNGHQENQAVAQKDIDANYFQHQPYLDSFNKSNGTRLVAIAAIHVEPFGAYSRKHQRIADLPEGATVAIPGDPSNGARALLLLHRHGLITLKNPDNILATARDIVANPKKLQFRELDGALLPRVLGDVDLALINTNYALQANLKPGRDALLIEGSQSPYANIVVAREDNRNHPALAKVLQALKTPEVKRFIEERFQGAVVPVF